MPITLIACVIKYKEKLAIGKNSSLLFKLKKDLEFFKNITTNQENNVVLMGRKTWFSISRENRPLKNRINMVLTNDPDLLKISPYSRSIDKNVCFLTFDQFVDYYSKTNANVFVIGGAEIYNKFLKIDNDLYKPSCIYLTEVYNFKFDNENIPNIFMDNFSEKYKIIYVSEKHNSIEYNVSYRILKYNYFKDNISEEHSYLKLAKQILENGNLRVDRTNVGTISLFGKSLTFDISQTIPLLTTKRVPWKHCIEELLWFMRGDTNSKILQRKNIKIWDGNTSREFLDSRNLHHYETGILGPGYGWQWRHFGANYSQSFSDTSNIDTTKIGGFDQLEYIENLLKNDPFSRRILMSYWNPPDFEKTALIPCHFSSQFYVEEINGERYLSCLFNMRSNDLFLGNPFNIFSYAVLTYILALRCDMKPHKLIYMGGDIHIYKNHIEQIKKQLNNSPRPFPKLLLNENIKNKKIKDINIDDFEIIGYFPHNSIKAQMAI